MNFKFKVIFDDPNREDRLYKTRGDILADLGFEFSIFNFSTIYRIQNNLLKERTYSFRIIKITF